MREENKSEIIHDALNMLDDEMIEEVDNLRGGIVEKKLIHPWRKWTALAASVCLLILIGGMWHTGLRLSEQKAEDENINEETNNQPGIDIELNTGTDSIIGDMSTEQIEHPEAEYLWAYTVIGGENYDTKKVETEVMEFSLRLFENNLKLENESKNVLISPASVLNALGMTSFGAREETLSQMENVFGISRGNLNRYLADEMYTSSENLSIANSIWFTDDERFVVEPEFLRFNKEFFQFETYETSFDKDAVKDMNAWVERKTNGKIKEVVNEIPEDIVMYLVNALSFEAEWENKYTELQIKEGIFTTQDGIEQQIEMMCGKEKLYLEDENAAGFMKYYKNRKYAFVALLPKEDISVSEYAETLTGVHLLELLSNPKEAKVYTQIPQFSYDYSVKMQEILKPMGMVDLFDVNKADLKGLGVYEGRNLYVSNVLHKTFIEVTPLGTKAGAATVVEVPSYGGAMEPEEVKEVYLDRPFIYMIIDCESNQPVFVGAVNSIK